MFNRNWDYPVLVWHDHGFVLDSPDSDSRGVYDRLKEILQKTPNRVWTYVMEKSKTV
ncbi:unnamed protein product, partial [Amoebophrya sp. A25]|eukprot:GSA25T00027904001.1